MEFKYASWIVLTVGVSINILGLFWFIAILIGLVGFLIGFLTILYLQHGDLDKFLDSGLLENPLDEPKTLGLSIVCDQKPSSMLLISPNIKVQTESRKSRLHALASSEQGKRRNLLDAGIELLFKKRTGEGTSPSGSNGSSIGTQQTKSSGSGLITDNLMHKGHLHFHQKDYKILDNAPPTASARELHGKLLSPSEEKPGRWRPFENIKIHTDKGKTIQLQQQSHQDGDRLQRRKDVGAVQMGEEVTTGASASPLASFKSYITHPEILLHRDSPPGSPKKKKILSGNKAVDKLIHTIVDYVIRDFIDSWFTAVSDSREFSETNIRTSIETLILKVCQRVKSAELLPLMTTKLIDDLARHTRFYRLATQENSSKQTNGNDQKRLKIHEKLSPQKRNQRGNGHRRNKSETDLTWHLGNAALQKNVANSKFYGVQADEQSLLDPDTMLLNSFFGFCDDYKQQCMDEEEMLEYFKSIAETVLYFTLPEEDFNCQTLRALLSNILANSLLKPLVSTLTDPDFINLQIAKHFAKDPPSGEFLLKMIRQSHDLSELRACRQLITKEMDEKYKIKNSGAELASLKYTQKLIDLRISHLQSNKSDLGKTSELDRGTPNLLHLGLDIILRKDLAVSYYLDYLSVLNLQKYVLFYLTAQEWKFTTIQSFSDINVIPVLLDTILDFSYHDTGIQHDLSADSDLIGKAADFLALHLADTRVILASCKDALIQALGSLTCHQAGIRALEQASPKSQQAFVRALLRPYENRAWGQSNWLLLRFWLGDGFGYRESRPPCVWQGGKEAGRSLGLYRSRAKNGSHTGLLHLVAPACPSKHFQRMISEILSKDEPYCTTFLNSVLSQLNWAFSEFIHILQDIQNVSQRDEQQVIETKQLKICSMCFELTVSLMRALEMILTITPGLLQDASRANSEIILGRICQLAIQVLSRVTIPPGCFQHVMDLCLPDLSNVTHFAIISAAIGILLALMKNELLEDDTTIASGSSSSSASTIGTSNGTVIGITKIPRISKHLLTDTSFHITSLEFALGEIKTPIAASSHQAPRGNFDPKMRAHIDPLTNEVRVPSPFRAIIGVKEIVPDPPIIKFNMADYPSHVTKDELNKVRRLIEILQLRQTLLSEITVLSEDSLCPICYAKQNSAVFDPCQHQSCENCIIQHLMNNKQCFYCKLAISKVVRTDGAVIYENSVPLKISSTTTGSSQTDDISQAVDEGDGPSGSPRL